MTAVFKPMSISLCDKNTKYILDKVAEAQKKNSRYKKSHYLQDVVTHLRERSEAKPKKMSMPVIANNIPDNLNILAWEAWIDFRKQTKCKKYKSDAPMKKLAKMGNYDDQMLIVQQSIDNEYQGLFPLKGNQKQQGVKQFSDITNQNIDTIGEWLNE